MHYKCGQHTQERLCRIPYQSCRKSRKVRSLKAYRCRLRPPFPRPFPPKPTFPPAPTKLLWPSLRATVFELLGGALVLELVGCERGAAEEVGRVFHEGKIFFILIFHWSYL